MVINATEKTNKPEPQEGSAGAGGCNLQQAGQRTFTKMSINQNPTGEGGRK